MSLLLQVVLALLLLCCQGSSMPQVESQPQWEADTANPSSNLTPQPPSTSTSIPSPPSSGTPPPHPFRDALRLVWIEGAALGLEWSSKFSVALNGAVTAYNLTLTKPQETQAFTSVTMYHAAALRHQFEDLTANTTYKGRLVALVGQHYWPYSLLGFTFTSPVLKIGHGLGHLEGRVPSDISDLEDVNVAVSLRWSPAPFVMGGSSGPSVVGGRATHPTGYRLSVWDHKQLVQEITTSVSDNDKGSRVTLKNLLLDTQYKVTLEGLQPKGRVGLTLSFSLDTGGLHVGE
ncbi:uncharacterized protein LOC122248951 [Penaeus japonicus]|uniref:uncharacterized protein LOC122248951 n=1 Tax=Penaeus japonicus TaxID=27405 RepID=UPI001C716AC3|nr:uncharacterized protein LOC122248951 [Penaeus japonicus]